MSEYEENVKLNRERHALVEKDKREEFIDKLIMPALPDYKKAFARPRVSDIVDKFIGRDMDTLSVLQYAAENKRFDEFMDKLEEHYYNNIRCVAPEARMVLEWPGGKRAEYFFIECYVHLGIKPQKKK